MPPMSEVELEADSDPEPDTELFGAPPSDSIATPAPPPPSVPSNVAALVEATLEDAVLRVPELRAVLPVPPAPASRPVVDSPIETLVARTSELRPARTASTHPSHPPPSREAHSERPQGQGHGHAHAHGRDHELQPEHGVVHAHDHTAVAHERAPAHAPTHDVGAHDPSPSPEHGHAHDHAHDHAHSHGHDHVPHAHPHDHGRAHGHGHDHPHTHGDAHGHSHGHGTASDRKLHRDELGLGSGRGKVLFLDAPSGLAGDMIVGALVDLGVPESVVLDAIAKLGLTGFHVHFGGREQSGIVATTFHVHVDAPQPERTFRAVRALILASELPQKVKDRALLVFEKLGRAEAKVHKMPIDDVHFHEVGAVDALCDVVGAAAALEYLGAEIVVSPLPLGRGFVKARHGILPLPAPAALECLQGFPTYDAGIDRELVTPTGAAIVGANASRASRWPDIRIERVGFGSGTQTFPDRPNLLRVVLGPVAEGAQITPSVGTHAILEANLDDATGEIVAHCIDMLLREGALDAWATPTTTKKGRPGLVLACLVQVPLADRLTASLLRESTTIGVRRTDVSRVTRPRRETVVQTPYGPISVKVSEGPFGTPQQKPEFDECVRAAAFHRVPVREVLSAALEAARASREV